MSILEEHGWDLQNAVHATMNFSVDQSESVSSPRPPPSQTNQPKQIKFNINFDNQFMAQNIILLTFANITDSVIAYSEPFGQLKV